MSKSKPKICFVGELNSVHLQKWVDHFKNSKFLDVFVISASKGPFPGVPYTYYNELLPSWFLRLPTVPKLTFLIKIVVFKRFLRELSPDILHIHQIGSFGVLFGLTNYHPLVVSTWGSDIIDDDPNSKVGKRKRRVLLQADLITATSVFLAKETEKFIDGSKKVEVVPFGVDIKIFDPGRFKKASNNKVVRIGFAKHLKPIYGVEMLIEAFKKVSEKFNSVELLIAGKGELEGRLKKLARELQIDKKTKFIGWVPNEKIPEFLSKIDIFVMPTIVPEAFGVSAIEASAMELPVVASNIGGIPEVVKNGKTGILIEPKNVSDLAEAIIKLIENRELRNTMGRAGREFVEKNYEWEQSIVKMRKLYSSLFENKRFNGYTI